MSDIKAVLGVCKQIEATLERQWGGHGRGMKEKLASTTYPVPQPLVKCIRYLATERNKAVHEPDYEIADVPRYLALARQAQAGLQQALPRAVQEHRRRQRRTLWGAVAVAALVLSVLFFGAGRDEPPAPVAPTKPAPPRVTGTHVGVRNGVVAFEEVSFDIAPDRLDRLEPRAFVQLRNTSGATLSSLVLEARLYIDGEARPVAETKADAFGDRLYVFFADTGLAPGASGRFEVIGLDRLHAFKVPDVLRARRRDLVLRVASASDGRRRELAAASAGWPQVAAQASPQP